ncbi:MAG: Ig-like domain repeat protein, partial [Actinobacteria bacterium]
VDTPNGLAWGDNRVRVTLAEQGVREDRTLDVTVTIPAGTPLTGAIQAAGTGSITEGDGSGSGSSSGPSVDRRTVAEVVEELSGLTPMNLVTVKYFPGGAPDEDPMDGPPSLDTPAGLGSSVSIGATETTRWVVAGNVTKCTSMLFASPSDRVIRYGSSVGVSGRVVGAGAGAIEVYRRYVGDSTETLVATASVSPTGGFRTVVEGLERSSAIRVRFTGTPEVLGSESRFTVKVAPRVALVSSATSVRAGTSVRFTARLTPAGATGLVAFERMSGGRWVRFAAVTPTGGRASATWTPPLGVQKIRARYLGGDGLAAGASATVSVRVRP